MPDAELSTDLDGVEDGWDKHKMLTPGAGEGLGNKKSRYRRIPAFAVF